MVSSALARASGADRLDGWRGDGFVTRDAKNAARAAFDAARPPGQRRDDVEAALILAASRGIAVLHECGGPLLTSSDDFADVLEAGRRPDLPRTVGYWAEAVTEPEQAAALVALHGAAGLGGDLNIDGSIGSHTAHLREGYADDPGCRGTAYRSASDVRDHVAACAVAGVQSGFHVIGDAGMDIVLEGYEAAARLVGADVVRATRPRLEHAEMADAEAVRRMARLGMVASVQPGFDAFWGGPEGMYAQRLGPARVPGTNPWRPCCVRECASRSARTPRSRRSTRGPASGPPSGTTTPTSGSTWRPPSPPTRSGVGLRLARTGEESSASAGLRPLRCGPARMPRPAGCRTLPATGRFPRAG